MDKGYKRRNFFIKRDFQGRLILGYFLFVTGGCLFFIVLLGLFSADSMTISYNNHDIQFGQTPFMLIKSVLAAHWIFIVLGGAFLVLAAMLITHRIAGPIFRFEKALDSMNSGNLCDTIYLRGKDEGKELAEKINTFNLQLSQSLKAIRSNATAITTLINDAERGVTQQIDAESLKSILWAIQEHNQKTVVVCDTYKLKNE